MHKDPMIWSCGNDCVSGACAECAKMQEDPKIWSCGNNYVLGACAGGDEMQEDVSRVDRGESSGLAVDSFCEIEVEV